MMDLKSSETLKNLTRSFSAECQDGAKYQYLADMAVKQKLSQISTILKQLATNEMAHGKVFYDYISEHCPGGVEMVEIKATYPMQAGELIDMLKVEAENEQRQADTIYPSFSKIAKKEGFEDLAEKYLQIAKIEACHADVLNQLYTKLSNNSLYSKDKETKWKCVNCGHEGVNKKAWKKCPICSMDQGFVKITLCGNSDEI